MHEPYRMRLYQLLELRSHLREIPRLDLDQNPVYDRVNNKPIHWNFVLGTGTGRPLLEPLMQWILVVCIYAFSHLSRSEELAPSVVESILQVLDHPY